MAKEKSRPLPKEDETTAAAPVLNDENDENALPAQETEPDSADTPTDTPDADTAAPTEPDQNDNSAPAEQPAPSAAENPPPEEQFSFKTLVRDVKGLLARYDLPDMLLTRFIGLYFLMSGFWVLYFRNKFMYRPVDNWREFVTSMTGTPTYLICSVIFLIAGFASLSSFSHLLPKHSRVIDQTVAIGGVLFFDIAMLWRVNNFFMTVAVAFVSLVFIYYALSKLPSRKPFRRISWTFCGAVCLAATVLITAFIASRTVYRHMIFGTACHDFGLFVQMYHYLSHGIHAFTTCERDRLLSHFNIHSSYIYYALVPFYKIAPKESTLLIAQAILAMGGAIPTFFIAKNHKYKGASLIFITFAYVFSISLISPCFYDFHENAFLPTLLMWLFFAIDRKNWILTWIMTVLVCIVKEDAPLYIICIGLFIFFEMKDDRKRWQGLTMAGLGGCYITFITKWLTANGDGSTMTTTRFGSMLISPDGGLGEVIRNVLIDPSYFFSLLVRESTLGFFLKVMLPLLFLPFLTKKIHRFWLMVPFIIMNLAIGANYGYAADIDYHYIFGPFCLLLYLTILNLDDISEEKQNDCAVMLGSAALIFFVGLPLHHLDTKESYINSQPGFEAVENALDTIPQDATVCAGAFFVSHCADRDQLYLYDFNDTNHENADRTVDVILEPDRYDFIVFGPNTELGQFSIPILESLGWTVFQEVPGRVIIYQSPDYVAAG